MKIRNKKEYIEAVCIRRQLKNDISMCHEIFHPGKYPALYPTALLLIEIYDQMVDCYHKETYLLLKKEP